MSRDRGHPENKSGCCSGAYRNDSSLHNVLHLSLHQSLLLHIGSDHPAVRVDNSLHPSSLLHIHSDHPVIRIDNSLHLSPLLHIRSIKRNQYTPAFRASVQSRCNYLLM